MNKWGVTLVRCALCGDMFPLKERHPHYCVDVPEEFKKAVGTA